MFQTQNADAPTLLRRRGPGLDADIVAADVAAAVALCYILKSLDRERNEM